MKSGKKWTKTETFLFVFTLMFLSLALGLNAYWTLQDRSAAYTVTTGRAAPIEELSSVSSQEEETGSVTITPEYPLDLNSATENDLKQLPGIGDELARRIVEYRAARGGFSSPEELKNVSGIGEKKYEAIAELVTVKGGTA